MLILLLVFRFDWTLLHVSAHFGELEVCRLLLHSGADVNAIDK